ncbi:hypothetical protein N7466_011466 [Penicillium verhagenii]|uniref:uncharacterized protein n=1 Tax=Penicillium verhagenii TaxID=1562060 RepID=UPI00254532C3|nr:uncharacterized protein N7466_011466 [Penicillium verhagenii]KAJ5915533.1 hypothetical protein N7466_011466 [Penicillium verhagenii]
MPSQTLVGVVLVAIVLYATKLVVSRKKASGPLPPGPVGKPVLGNIADLPAPGEQDWVHWAKHKELYGPISSITVMGQTIVILNDSRIATDLLVKRSAIHSSRPNLVFASEMVGWEHIMAMQTYSDRFRAYRKATQPYLGHETAVSHEAGAIILKIAYGYTIEPHKLDPLVQMAGLALEHFAIAGTPGAWLVDMIPALKYVPSWLPGAGFKRKAQAWKKNLQNTADIPYAFVQRQMKGKQPEPSYLSNLFKADGIPAAGTEEEVVAKWTAASLYTGGADTTVSSVATFFLAMTLYPEVQRKAQEEIDRVLGAGQLPKMADRANLPYINAVVKETLRWHPVAPMGIPHMSNQDDMYEGYHIPKGSLIMPNIWALTHDPEVYHDPMTFKPERFLGVDGREPETDPRSVVFGFGRRACPGRLLAENTVYLSVSRSLAVFNIGKAVENGKEVEVKAEFQPGVISHPVAWKYDMKPRSPAHEALILSVEKEHPWEESDAAALKV